MNVPLFRHEVIEAQRDRLTGTVIAATPPRSGLYLAIVLAVMASLILLLLLGSYAPRVQVKGQVAFDGGMSRLHSNAAGEIRAVHAREGQHVEAGAPILTVALAQGTNGLADQLNVLDAQDRQLADQQRLAGSLADAEIASLEQQRSSVAATLASLERQRGLAASQASLAESELRRARALAAEGAGSARQVEESRAAVLARRSEVEGIGERIIQQQDALRAAAAAASQRRLESERSRSALAGQRLALSEQRSALSRQDSLTLTAPISGRVEQLSAQPGARVSPEAPLATIVPAGARMQVWLYAPSRGAGFVREGQQVSLHFDAFPHQIYGPGGGTVIEVSRVPIDGRTLDPDLRADEPVFRIRASIDRLPAAAHGGERLRAGMAVAAHVAFERRSLWELLFNPFAEALR